MNKITPEQLKQLEERIRELVSELPEECNCSDQRCTDTHWSKPSLEHCRVATERYMRPRGLVSYERNKILLGSAWQDLQPWQDQTEAHKFLFTYLCNE